MPERGRRKTAVTKTRPRESYTVRWLWAWIAKERERRGITRSEFARRVGARRETLYRAENRQMDSSASLLLDALEKLGALGAVAEIDSMGFKGAVISLSEKESERYDAIARENGLTRDLVIRQLAAEGLIARPRKAKPVQEETRAGSDRVVFLEVGMWYDEIKQRIEVRSMSESQKLKLTVGRDSAEPFDALGTVLRSSGVISPEPES